jgi:hypothetical protein
VYDNASVWSETRNSIGDYINEQTSPVSIDGIAIGTDRDDAQMIAYLDIEDADDDDYYSILGMKECHSMSWNWFWSYARAGNNMIALPKLQIWNDNPDLRGVGLPDRAYLTPDFAMPKFTPFSK